MAIIEVWTAEDLWNVRNNMYGEYIQMADIDLSVYDSWLPIGRVQYNDSTINNFRGSYNGNGFKISNLKTSPVIDSYGYDVGLFAIIYSSELKNIRLENALIYGESECGLLAGLMYDSCHIENCSVQGKIIINGAGTWGSSGIGGLIGSSDSDNLSFITGCSTDVLLENMYSIANNVGGFMGLANGIITIEKSHSNGSIYYQDEGLTNNMKSIGGFIGKANMFSQNLNISKCYSNMNITGIEDIGGFIGYFVLNEATTSSVSNCYSIGNIKLPSNSALYIGGFIGEINSYNSNDNVEISNCYSAIFINNVGEVSTIKAFLGYLSRITAATIQDCFYDSNILNYTDLYAVGKITSEMKNQNTFLNWDFNNIWDILPSINDGYPHFKKASTEIYVIVFNEITQQKELKQAQELKLITGTNELKQLVNIEELKIITDTGLK